MGMYYSAAVEHGGFSLMAAKGIPQLLTPDEVCALIDEYPNIIPEVARIMKDAIQRGELPYAVAQSLKLERYTMYRRYLG